ncbi:MAG: hypothetical protein AAGC77_01195 [Pseudomonadota bacterium]
MSFDKQTALNAIYAAIDEINETLEDGQRLDKSPNEIIFGDGGKVDSVGLVNLVMATEQQLYDLAGQEVLLASEAAMSRKRSPYRSVDALADYAVEVATGADAA